MKTLATIGRILFALPFGIIGLNHFLMTDFFLGIKTSFIPIGVFTILITGVFLIAASISIILNKNIKIACICLAVLLFIFIVSIHIPGLSTPEWRLSLIELLKDSGLMGASIMIAIYSDVIKAHHAKLP